MFGRWVEKANQPSLRRQRLWIGRLQAQRMQRSPRLGLLNSERLLLDFLNFYSFSFYINLLQYTFTLFEGIFHTAAFLLQLLAVFYQSVYIFHSR